MTLKKKIVVLSGAGISAESGLRTFRDAEGLWEGHDVMEVASPQGWRRNPQLVLDFYNSRRKQLHSVRPNQAHVDLVALEEHLDVTIVTQNVDDLHERAGSRSVIHLHGELLKACSTANHDLTYSWTGNINLGDRAEDGSQLRPYIVWFGEPVPMIERAIEKILEAEIFLIVGTSLQVYPAAALVQYVSNQAQIIYVDPSPTISYELQARKNLTIIQSPATRGIREAIEVMQVLS